MTVVAAAIRLPALPTDALFPVAGALLLLIFIGIHNAWDIVTTIVVERLLDPPASTPKADEQQPSTTTEDQPVPAQKSIQTT